MTTADKDLVYILGTGSRVDNMEIRYSLRSIEKNLPHRNVVIVGECPDFLKDVIHIASPDKFKNKQMNLAHKISLAAQDERVSEDFILMNDDYFILKPIEDLPEWIVENKTCLDYAQDSSADLPRSYFLAMGWLAQRGHPHENFYDGHFPMLFNKAKHNEMFGEVPWEQDGFATRTIYGNLFCKNPVPRPDTKVQKNFEVFERKRQGDILSTSNVAAQMPWFQEWIAKEFPTPSKYEK